MRWIRDSISFHRHSTVQRALMKEMTAERISRITNNCRGLYEGTNKIEPEEFLALIPILSHSRRNPRISLDFLCLYFYMAWRFLLSWHPPASGSTLFFQYRCQYRFFLFLLWSSIISSHVTVKRSSCQHTFPQQGLHMNISIPYQEPAKRTTSASHWPFQSAPFYADLPEWLCYCT